MGQQLLLLLLLLLLLIIIIIIKLPSNSQNSHMLASVTAYSFVLSKIQLSGQFLYVSLYILFFFFLWVCKLVCYF